MRWFLVTLSGEDRGKELLLLSPEIRLGRVFGNDIIIPDASVSRHHCSIFMDGDMCLVQDMNSKNGIFVNAQKVSKTQLFEKDILKVGGTEFQLMCEAPAIQAAPEVHVPEPEKKSLRDFKLPAMQLKETPQGKMILFVMCIVIPFIILGISRSFVQSNPGVGVAKKSDERPAEEMIPLSGQEFLDPSKVSQLKGKADTALLMRDYPAAYVSLKKLANLLPKDARVASQLKLVEKKLKKEIATHDENGLREYEKLNYDRAIVEWRKVVSLSKDFDTVRYDDMLLRIKEAEAKMVSSKP